GSFGCRQAPCAGGSLPNARKPAAGGGVLSDGPRRGSDRAASCRRLVPRAAGQVPGDAGEESGSQGTSRGLPEARSDGVAPLDGPDPPDGGPDVCRRAQAQGCGPGAPGGAAAVAGEPRGGPPDVSAWPRPPPRPAA